MAKGGHILSFGSIYLINDEKMSEEMSVEIEAKS